MTKTPAIIILWYIAIFSLVFPFAVSGQPLTPSGDDSLEKSLEKQAVEALNIIIAGEPPEGGIEEETCSAQSLDLSSLPAKIDELLAEAPSTETPSDGEMDSLQAMPDVEGMLSRIGRTVVPVPPSIDSSNPSDVKASDEKASSEGVSDAEVSDVKADMDELLARAPSKSGDDAQEPEQALESADLPIIEDLLTQATQTGEPPEDLDQSAQAPLDLDTDVPALLIEVTEGTIPADASGTSEATDSVTPDLESVEMPASDSIADIFPDADAIPATDAVPGADTAPVLEESLSDVDAGSQECSTESGNASDLPNPDQPAP